MSEGRAATRVGSGASALVLIVLPLLIAAVDAVSFHLENRNNLRLVVAGEERQALVYVPPALDPARPVPLVLSLHGGAGWPALQRDVSGWSRLAERHGFLVVFPDGLDAGGMRGWRLSRPGMGLDRDVLFLSALIDELGRRYHIDPQRIYADGLSNGGGMAFVLSCTLADRFAAVGMVASAQTLPWSWCPDLRPMPMIAFHGTSDPLVPYRGGRTWVGPMTLPDVPSWVAQWAARNGCEADAPEIRVAADVIRREHAGCDDGAAVVLYTIDGGGHTWPGGAVLPEWFLGKTSRSVDATKEIWAFFERHPRQARDEP